MLHVEHALLLLIDPLFLGQRLALWAMSIAARRIDGLLEAARIAELDVATQCHGPALGDVRKGTPLSRIETVLPLELRSVSPNDVRDVEANGPEGGRHGLPLAVRQ
jgi:hypothetical protein